MANEQSSDSWAQRARVRAAVVSLVASFLLLSGKAVAYWYTGSAAVLSDALEGIINVFAAGVALGSIRLAHKPKDRNHPYGHGKIEFVSAAFEGGLISFAAVVIFYQAIRSFYLGPQLQELDFGLLIILGAGIGNAILGLYLIHTGRRTDSQALVADGKHVLTDFWTSAAVFTALILIRWTGKVWIDPVCAIAVGIHLGFSGMRLVRQALSGLLDEEDPHAVQRLVDAFESNLEPGIVDVHSVRIIRSGRFHHVDAHVVVPEFWDIKEAHDRAEDYERAVMVTFGTPGEIEFHIEPCEQLYCGRCPLEECPVRQQAFEKRDPLTVEGAVQPDPPQEWNVAGHGV